MKTSISKSLSLFIRPCAADPNSNTRCGLTLATIRRVTSSRSFLLGVVEADVAIVTCSHYTTKKIGLYFYSIIDPEIKKTTERSVAFLIISFHTSHGPGVCYLLR